MDKYLIKKARSSGSTSTITSRNADATLYSTSAEPNACNLGTPIIKGSCVEFNAEEVDYDKCLAAVLSVVRLLLQQGLPFHCQEDEFTTSLNEGNFLELLKFLCEHNDRAITFSALEYCKLTSLKVQKELVSACVTETRSTMFSDIGDGFFSLIVGKSPDISLQEHMTVVLRFVNKLGDVIERLILFEHETDMSSQSLENVIDMLFARHGLPLSRLRGQSYDGASNITPKFNDFRSYILKENSSAYYVHYFGHELQLVVVAVAKSSPSGSDFFYHLSRMMNLVGTSCKSKDIFRNEQHEDMLKCFESGEISSGKEKYQETSTQSGDTLWSSHHRTILRLFEMWPSVVEGLEVILEDAIDQDLRGIAYGLLENIEKFKFAFMLHLMKDILEITNDLSEALQQKTRNILNVVKMVRVMKLQLQSLREEKWETFLEDVKKFCIANFIEVPNMEEMLPIRGRSRHNGQAVTYLHLYRVEIFCGVIDLISGEMSSRFTERNTELLLCIGSLDPRNSFSNFDHEKLLQLAQFYPEDFSPIDQELLKYQLHNFIYDVRNDTTFSKLQNIEELAVKMVKTDRHSTYPLVYRLIELALVLPVTPAATTGERVYSAMESLKTYMCNRMEDYLLNDELLNDSMVVYIEQEIFRAVDDEAILLCYKNMQNHTIQLSSLTSSSKESSRVGN